MYCYCITFDVYWWYMNYLQQSIKWVLIIVIIGMAFHTPVTVFVEARWPEYELLAKAWKEILLGGVAVLLAWQAWRVGELKSLLHDKFVILTALIGVLHLVLLILIDNNYVSELAGLLIDLRYYLFFIEMYVALRLTPSLRRPLLVAAAIGAAVIVGFGGLQAIVLPKDVLSPLGYSDATIKPYLTVDLNHDYIRINSTLRGPNPVGAFAVMTLAMLGAWVAARRSQVSQYRSMQILVGAAAVASLVVLYASQSRSAWLAALLVAILIYAVSVSRKVAAYSAIAAVCCGLVLTSSLYIHRNNATVSHLFFHSNPDGGSPEKSDEGHWASLQHGTQAAMGAPAGEGIGSTGSASLLSDKPVIIENQYLFMLHESGWLGLALQLVLFGMVLITLWRGRRGWLQLGLSVAGLGLALIGLLLPVWADDTVSLYWWGLAGLALGSSAIIKTHGNPTKPKSHQKAKRTT